QAKILTVFNTLIRYYKEPLRRYLKHFKVGIQIGLEMKNIEFFCHYSGNYCSYLFLGGECLKRTQRRTNLIYMVFYVKKLNNILMCTILKFTSK
ncbi:MAG: hypothetical protein ACRCU2_17685, partial [Planktothrix sp.]